MTSVNDVYRKIKEISKRTANPRPAVQVLGIANELRVTPEQLVPFLTELKDLRLIQFGTSPVAFVKLTLLGYTVQR
jgi:hypothetical protein